MRITPIVCRDGGDRLPRRCLPGRSPCRASTPAAAASHRSPTWLGHPLSDAYHGRRVVHVPDVPSARSPLAPIWPAGRERLSCDGPRSVSLDPFFGGNGVFDPKANVTGSYQNGRYGVGSVGGVSGPNRRPPTGHSTRRRRPLQDGPPRGRSRANAPAVRDVLPRQARRRSGREPGPPQ